MKKYIIGVSIMTIFGCISHSGDKTNRNGELTVIQGDLYFKLISLGSYYNIPDSSIYKFERLIDSLSKVQNLSSSDKKLINHVKILKKNNLINKPFFHLIDNTGEIITVYLDESDFELVAPFERQELIDENKKIKISMNGKFLEDQIFFCKEIIGVKKVNGKTYWRK